MYRSRQLSDLELDAIDLYEMFPTKSVETIACELLCPVWYIQNCIFKHINGQVVDGYYQKSIKKSNGLKLPRRSLIPTKVALELQKQTTKESGIKLRTHI